VSSWQPVQLAARTSCSLLKAPCNFGRSPQTSLCCFLLAWQAHVEAVRGRLSELSAGGLALECSQWLDQLSQQLRQLGGRLLGPCASGQGLLSVEAAVKAALEGWQYALQATRCACSLAGQAAGSV
jgi:hypothetical protein